MLFEVDTTHDVKYDDLAVVDMLPIRLGVSQGVVAQD